MRRRLNSTERAQPRPRPLPMQSVPPPGAFCARRRGQGLQYAQVDALLGERFAAQHRTRNRRFAHEHCPADKKALANSPPLPRLRPKKDQKKDREVLELDEMWTLVGQKSARSGFGWPSNGPAAASWPGRWAAGARPRPAVSGRSCPAATGGTAGTSPMSGKPTPPSCPATSTGRARRAKDKPTLSRPSTVPGITAAAYW